MRQLNDVDQTDVSARGQALKNKGTAGALRGQEKLCENWSLLVLLALFEPFLYMRLSGAGVETSPEPPCGREGRRGSSGHQADGNSFARFPFFISEKNSGVGLVPHNSAVWMRLIKKIAHASPIPGLIEERGFFHPGLLKSTAVRMNYLTLVRPAKSWHVQWEIVPPGKKSETP